MAYFGMNSTDTVKCTVNFCCCPPTLKLTKMGHQLAQIIPLPFRAARSAAYVRDAELFRDHAGAGLL